MIQLRPAEGLLQSLGVASGADIDVEAIAFHTGAFVRYRPLDGCEARIIGAGDRAIITVNSLSIQTRKRFSVGHELGHWHHHRGRSFVCRAEDIGNPRKGPLDVERVADEYAADLLMPAYLFEPLARGIGRTSFKAVDELRREFNTSLRATAIRLAEFGPEPAMLVCHAKGGRRWFYRPAYVPDKWFPQEQLDGQSFAMDVLFDGKKQSHRALIGADAWFDRRDAEDYELYEESCFASHGEILTFLVFKDQEMLE